MSPVTALYHRCLFNAFALLFSVPLVLCGDAEIGLGTPQLIEHWGYPGETIEAITSDGYILMMHRIPYGRNGSASRRQLRPVVFLQHGLEETSSDWVKNLPEKSLGFMLADQGYDVWMGNFRGNVYSREHVELDATQSNFWQFTWQQMYKYDLSAMIDKALQVTNQSYVYYVGHSQGTLTMFAKLATEPEFNAKVKKFFALAPVASVGHIRGLLQSLAASSYMYKSIEIANAMGLEAFTPDNEILKQTLVLLCGTGVPRVMCSNFVFMMTGPESSQMNYTRFPVYITDIPGGTSTMNILHWMQMVSSGEMQMYDYGWHNWACYGQTKPPIFDLSKINADTYLYWSAADWLADKQDIEGYLLPRLNKTALVGNFELQDFNHLDFLWGERAHKEVYTPVINFINEDEANTEI